MGTRLRVDEDGGVGEEEPLADDGLRGGNGAELETLPPGGGGKAEDEG
jgi:hypothetical protein